MYLAILPIRISTSNMWDFLLYRQNLTMAESMFLTRRFSDP